VDSVTERPEQRTAQTLVLGVGNLLLSDEGVGLRVVERLVTAYDIPDGVLTLDGGTLGLDLLYYLDGVENLLIVDAVEMGEKPGALVRLEGDEVPSFLSVKMSPHQIGVPDMLFAAKLRDLYPRNVVLWGVQPGSLEVGLELSPPVAAQVDVLVENILGELLRWGHRLSPCPEDGPTAKGTDPLG
jgi:hydrogenase maturation protease